MNPMHRGLGWFKNDNPPGDLRGQRVVAPGRDQVHPVRALQCRMGAAECTEGPVRVHERLKD